ncbi:MAG: DUF2262 domain-containing protein [Oscillospiraceae bacterium]|nr:DUF2262 domain-containing protein [Oscillospiraceae bacterium]
MLQITDFRHGDHCWEDYYTAGTLWGQALRHDISVSFADALGKGEETLAAALPAINSKIAFIEENSAAIKESAAYLHELAEEWLYELVENEDDTEVELEDGSTVSTTVTPERFMESLFPVAMSFKFKENLLCCQAYLELLCEPDWFAGHRIHIKINEENGIECEGI